MHRRLPLAALAAAFALALATPRANADDKCTIATKPDSVIGKACADGGRKEAKKLMKAMVKTAAGKGVKFTCEDCHKDLEKFELTAKATKDLPKLLEAAGKK